MRRRLGGLLRLSGGLSEPLTTLNLVLHAWNPQVQRVQRSGSDYNTRGTERVQALADISRWTL